MASTVGAGEPKARRTHARRSCDMCKVRKTRCELPDIDVPSSTEPLPPNKRCHRCKVLHLPCVVDDSRLKKRRRRAGTAQSSQTGTGTGGPPSKRSSSASTTPGLRSNEGPLKRMNTGGSVTGAGTNTEDTGPVNVVDHGVDVSAAYIIDAAEPNLRPGQQSTWTSPLPRARTSRPTGEAAARTLRLHGRPLSLTSAMLSVASRKLYDRLARRVVTVADLDLDNLVNAPLRVRLSPGFSQLRTYHPHLQPLPDLFSILRQSPDDPSIQLLVSTTVYVSAMSLPHDPDVHRLRDQLARQIVYLQQIVLSHQLGSFHAIQALEMLSLHSPFAPALPYQITDPRMLAPARGVVSMAFNIGNRINLNAIANGPLERWSNPDFWLWLGLHASEAQMALEDERPRKPKGFVEFRMYTWTLTAPENGRQWINAVSTDDPAELLGKLTVSDRLARLDELHDTLGRIRGILETAHTVQNYQAPQAIVDEMDYYNTQLLEIDRRHERVLSLLSLPRGLESGWRAYRNIRRHWESMKAYMSGFQALVALHYLPGSAVAVSGLPSHFTTAQALHYALNRANEPQDVLMAYATNSMATEDMHSFVRHQGAQAEQILSSFVDLSQGLAPSEGAAEIAPLHEIIAVVVESAKSLMEQHASQIMYYRSILTMPESTPTPSWLPVLSQATTILHSLGAVSLGDDSSGTGPHSSGAGESLANGCSNLLGSMARAVQEWSGMTGQEGAAALAPVPALADYVTAAGGLTLSDSPVLGESSTMVSVHPGRSSSASTDTMGSSSGQATAGFHSYYPSSSDRWIGSSGSGSHAGGERSHSVPPTLTRTALLPAPNPPGYLGHTAGPSGLQAPQSQSLSPAPPGAQPLDSLISEMFGQTYSTMVPTVQQQQRAHTPGPHPSHSPIPPTPMPLPYDAQVYDPQAYDPQNQQHYDPRSHAHLAGQMEPLSQQQSHPQHQPHNVQMPVSQSNPSHAPPFILSRPYSDNSGTGGA